MIGHVVMPVNNLHSLAIREIVLMLQNCGSGLRKSIITLPTTHVNIELDLSTCTFQLRTIYRNSSINMAVEKKDKSQVHKLALRGMQQCTHWVWRGC